MIRILTAHKVLEDYRVDPYPGIQRLILKIHRLASVAWWFEQHRFPLVSGVHNARMHDNP